MRLAIASALACMSSVSAQEHEARAAAEILRDFDRVAMPSMSDGNDADSAKRFRDAVAAGCRRKGNLALELYRTHPEHRRVADLMATRWAGLTNAAHEPNAVVAETTELLGQGDLSDELERAALRARTHALIVSPSAGNVERIRSVRELLAADPEGEYTGICLLDLVRERLYEPARMTRLLEQVAAQWPESGYVGRPAKSWLRVLGNVGKPFVGLLPEGERAAFIDAIPEATPFTVVQVWSGWVRDGAEDPQVAELAAMRREFGATVALVGLLNGKFEARLPEARAAGVEWPQLRAADPAPMTTPCGVPSLPCYFVLDRDLKIVGITGRAAAATARLRQLRGV